MRLQRPVCRALWLARGRRTAGARTRLLAEADGGGAIAEGSAGRRRRKGGEEK